MQTAERNRWLREFAALFLFALWTAAVSLIDVRAIGPNGSTVGLAALNGRIHDLTGVPYDAIYLNGLARPCTGRVYARLCASRSCPMDKPKKPF